MNPTNCHKLEGPKGFMPTCHEVALMVARGDFKEAPWHKRFLMRFHLSMCKVCGPFARQFELLSKAFRAKWGKPPDPGAVSDLKKKLKDKLIR